MVSLAVVIQYVVLRMDGWTDGHRPTASRGKKAEYLFEVRLWLDLVKLLRIQRYNYVLFWASSTSARPYLNKSCVDCFT